MLERGAERNQTGVFLSGEAGIGKTILQTPSRAGARHHAALVWLRSMLDHVAWPKPTCVLRRSADVPGTGGEDLIDFLARCAPSWLVQMPWLLSSNRLENCSGGLGVTRDGCSGKWWSR